MYVCVCVCVCVYGNSRGGTGNKAGPEHQLKPVRAWGGNVNKCKQLPKSVLAWGHQLSNHSLRLYQGLLRLIKAVLRLY
jgi:hypothetical protein